MKARTFSWIDRERAHYRQHRRRRVEVDARLEIRLPGGEVYDRGRARLSEVSASGGLLVEVRTRRKSFPVGPFRIDVVLEGPEYGGIRLSCSPVRLVPDLEGIAVRLEQLSSKR
jgi:hypothetical protein